MKLLPQSEVKRYDVLRVVAALNRLTSVVSATRHTHISRESRRFLTG